MDIAPGWMNHEDMFIHLVTRELRDSPNTVRSNNLYVRNTPTSEQAGLGAKSLAEMMFVDAANGNYRLRKESPAVDTGLNLFLTGVTSDLLNNARPFGGEFDIGAYEYVGAQDFDDDILDFLPAILAAPKQNKSKYTQQ
jgi:hypothetical protein